MHTQAQYIRFFDIYWSIMSKIQALAKNDIHRICSGQAIADLGTSVKELVENALDAGATKVDIRLKE